MCDFFVDEENEEDNDEDNDEDEEESEVIYLSGVALSGTVNKKRITELISRIKIFDRLFFFKENTENSEKDLIAVRTEEGERIGHVPEHKALLIDMMMDAGKRVYGRLEKKEPMGRGFKIVIGVYAREKKCRREQDKDCT